MLRPGPGFVNDSYAALATFPECHSRMGWIVKRKGLECETFSCSCLLACHWVLRRAGRGSSCEPSCGHLLQFVESLFLSGHLEESMAFKRDDHRVAARAMSLSCMRLYNLARRISPGRNASSAARPRCRPYRRRPVSPYNRIVVSLPSPSKLARTAVLGWMNSRGAPTIGAIA